MDKFRRLAEGTIAPDEQRRFLDLVERLPDAEARRGPRVHLRLPGPGGEDAHRRPVLMFDSPAPASRKAPGPARPASSSGRLLRFPGAFNPLSALLIERLGFEGVYVSGAVVAASLALPDIGLTTLSEVAARSHEVARTTGLPDARRRRHRVSASPSTPPAPSTSWRTWAFPAATSRTRSTRNAAAIWTARRSWPSPTCAGASRRRPGRGRDPAFVICARTDARAVEGLDAAVERAKAYLDAGADMIFAEALADAAEIETLPRSASTPRCWSI